MIGAPDVMIWGMGPDDLTAKDYQDIGTKIWVLSRKRHLISIRSSMIRGHFLHKPSPPNQVKDLRLTYYKSSEGKVPGVK